jgi:hypothetical protein
MGLVRGFSIFSLKLSLNSGEFLGSGVFLSSLGGRGGSDLGAFIVYEDGVFVFGSNKKIFIEINVLGSSNGDELFGVVGQHFLIIRGNVAFDSLDSHVLGGTERPHNNKGRVGH